MTYWEEKYKELPAEAGNTPAERKALEMLAKGQSITECQEKSGLSLEEFFKLLERANAWETEHLCSPGPRLEETVDESVHQRAKKEN